MLPRNRVKSPVQEKITLVDRVQGRISTAPVLARPVLMILAVAFLPWLLDQFPFITGCGPGWRRCTWRRSEHGSSCGLRLRHGKGRAQ